MIDLLDGIAEAVDAARPGRPTTERHAGGRPRLEVPADIETEIRRRHALDEPDAAIGAAIGWTAAQVRRARRTLGLSGVGYRVRSDWEARVSDAHARGLTTPEIAAETGYSVRTVQEYLHRLGLRAHRLPRDP